MNAATNSAEPTSGKSERSSNRTTMPGVASALFRNALSSARIHSGLGTCETSGGTAKGTHDSPPFTKYGLNVSLKWARHDEATIRISE